MDREVINDAIAVLNRIHLLDPSVLPALIEHRVECNEALADDPTVQVADIGAGRFVVGLLGIINGLFGVDENKRGFIAAFQGQDGEISFGWVKAQIREEES